VDQWASDPLPGRNVLTFPGLPAPGDVTHTWAHRGWRTLFIPCIKTGVGNPLRYGTPTRGKRVRVCPASRSLFLSTVTTEGEVREAQRLLNRKPV